MFFSVREFLEAKFREPGGGSIWSAEGNRASNRLTRCRRPTIEPWIHAHNPARLRLHGFISADPPKSARTLRSAVGERGSGGGGERLAKRSRSVTPLPGRRRKPVADATVAAIPLATGARGV